jgi:hypothetical protein
VEKFWRGENLAQLAQNAENRQIKSAPNLMFSKLRQIKSAPNLIFFRLRQIKSAPSFFSYHEKVNFKRILIFFPNFYQQKK